MNSSDKHHHVRHDDLALLPLLFIACKAVGSLVVLVFAYFILGGFAELPGFLLYLLLGVPLAGVVLYGHDFIVKGISYSRFRDLELVLTEEPRCGGRIKGYVYDPKGRPLGRVRLTTRVSKRYKLKGRGADAWMDTRDFGSDLHFDIPIPHDLPASDTTTIGWERLRDQVGMIRWQITLEARSPTLDLRLDFPVPVSEALKISDEQLKNLQKLTVAELKKSRAPEEIVAYFSGLGFPEQTIAQVFRQLLKRSDHPRLQPLRVYLDAIDARGQPQTDTGRPDTWEGERTLLLKTSIYDQFFGIPAFFIGIGIFIIFTSWEYALAWAVCGLLFSLLILTEQRKIWFDPTIGEIETKRRFFDSISYPVNLYREVFINIHRQTYDPDSHSPDMYRVELWPHRVDQTSELWLSEFKRLNDARAFAARVALATRLGIRDSVSRDRQVTLTYEQLASQAVDDGDVDRGEYEALLSEQTGEVQAPLAIRLVAFSLGGLAFLYFLLGPMMQWLSESNLPIEGVAGFVQKISERQKQAMKNPVDTSGQTPVAPAAKKTAKHELANNVLKPARSGGRIKLAARHVDAVRSDNLITVTVEGVRIEKHYNYPAVQYRRLKVFLENPRTKAQIDGMIDMQGELTNRQPVALQDNQFIFIQDPGIVCAKQQQCELSLVITYKPQEQEAWMSASTQSYGIEIR